MIPEPFTLERVTVDWTRHGGDDRPKILPPPGVEWRSASGKTKQKGRYYARPSSYAKALEDSFVLGGWRLRRALVGIGQRRDYWVAAASLTIADHDRDELDKLAELCIEASGESNAVIGTALHSFTERLDRGEGVGNVPEEYRELVEAWARITTLLKFMYREVRTVNDELEVAGTPDAFGYCTLPDPDGVVDELRVIDLKSGGIKYPAGMATQLYLYAAPSTCLYDTETGERVPLEVNTRWGLIVHLKSDSTEPPGLHWINLEHGRQAVELAGPVRAWRAVKPDAILTPALVEDSVPATPDLFVDITDRLDGVRVAPPSPIVEAVAATVDRILEVSATTAERCELSDLLVTECACRAHRPDVPADALDDGDELTELELPRTLADTPTGPVEVPATYARTEAFALLEAIEQCVTDRDLELLWTTAGNLWTDEHRARAAEVMRELKARRNLERPRAALAAALRVADAGRLRALWTEHGGTPLWTDEHDAAAGARYAELEGAAA